MGSVQGRPMNSIPTGTPYGASAEGVENPAGTVMAGKPATEARMPLRPGWSSKDVLATNTC